MRHRRNAIRLVAAGLGLSTLALAGCAGSSPSPTALSGSTAASGSTASGSTAAGQVPPSASSTASTTAVSACSLLLPADVMAVAATFPHDTITIDGHRHSNTPPTNLCAFNQKGVYTADGLTNTSSGDQWAQLTVVADGASFAFDATGNDTIHGLGDGAYWDAGTNTVVIRKGQDVLQVSDEVPVNLSVSPDLATVYRQAAQALAAKILSHM